MDISARSN